MVRLFRLLATPVSISLLVNAQDFSPCPNLCSGNGHCDSPDRKVSYCVVVFVLVFGVLYVGVDVINVFSIIVVYHHCDTGPERER